MLTLRHILAARSNDSTAREDFHTLRKAIGQFFRCKDSVAQGVRVRDVRESGSIHKSPGKGIGVREYIGKYIEYYINILQYIIYTYIYIY